MLKTPRTFARLLLSLACMQLYPVFALDVVKTYSISNQDFPNPERGFYIQGEGTSDNIRQARSEKNITLFRRYFRLDEFRNTDLPKTFLDKLDAEFKTMRGAGAKMIPRFTYNFPANWDKPENIDAPLTRVLTHIGQLQSHLRAHSDVIAFMEAGFIGAWGEWHHSSSGLDTDVAKKAVLNRLLEAMPPERMVALRYNFHKRAIYGTDEPLSPAEAHGGSPRARTGAHNDCLGASKDDWGTYSWAGTQSGLDANIEKEKTFLNLDNLYVPQGGETCNPSPYSGCAAALADLKRMRWDVLNIGYHADVLQSWQSGGCLAEVKLRLGYRFGMLRAALPDSARPGGAMRLSLTLANTGWGKAYNPRGLEAILRHSETGQRYYLPLAQDPRLWLPGDTVTVTAEAGLPVGMPEGRYAVFLHLPDTVTTLRGRPEYSIRLANEGVWETSTGYNSLSHSVTVTRLAGGPAAQGTRYFLPWGQAPNGLTNRGPAAQPLLKWMGQPMVRRGSATLSFAVERAGSIHIRLLDLAGKVKADIYSGNLEAGSHFLAWTPGPDIRGLYLGQLRQGGRAESIPIFFP